MLITELKPKEEVIARTKGKVLLIQCEGCREVFFPAEQVNKFKQELKNSTTITDDITWDYLCNHEYTKIRIENSKQKIMLADSIIIFSCGVGLQVVSNLISKPVFPGCNTLYVNGFQGLTPNQCDCAQCGDCFLNYTASICPITTCSKSLLNGPCGGAKNGKCEVDKEMDCGWEKIYKKLESLGRADILKGVVKLRDYTKVI